ncbi:MAG: GAK system CofD-like protein [Planctomycetota bacterium]
MKSMARGDRRNPKPSVDNSASRCRRASLKTGPKILFFGGGSAPKRLSTALTAYTHNSIHLLTPFDSGGSSGELRRVFGMPSVGDLRSRLSALAVENSEQQQAFHRLFVHRIAPILSQAESRGEFEAILDGLHFLTADLSPGHRTIATASLRELAGQMPQAFDLRCASIGNLLLASRYLSSQRNLDEALEFYADLLGVRGLVRPTVDVDLELSAQLEDGRVIDGQHRITGKEYPALTSRIVNLRLVNKGGKVRTPGPAIDSGIKTLIKTLIRTADLICFPMGSFFTSLVANLLPQGVGREIAQSPSPKVFVPSLGFDPEIVGYSLADSVALLLEYLRRDAGTDCSTSELLNAVILADNSLSYPAKKDLETERRLIHEQGISVVMAKVAEGDGRRHDAEALARILVASRFA